MCDGNEMRKASIPVSENTRFKWISFFDLRTYESCVVQHLAALENIITLDSAADLLNKYYVERSSRRLNLNFSLLYNA